MTRQNISGTSPFEPIIGFSRAVRIGNLVHLRQSPRTQKNDFMFFLRYIRILRQGTVKRRRFIERNTCSLWIIIQQVDCRQTQRDIRRVPSRRHQHSPWASIVVACIHAPPAAIQPDFVPSAEVARASVRPPDVAQVASDVPRRDVLATR